MASSCTSEQRVVIKFYVLLGKSFTEIHDDLHKVYGDSCLVNSAISKWMRRFEDGRESTEDDKHIGRPVTITSEKKVAEIQEFILEDRRVTVETVARHFDISYGTARDIMTNKLGMRRVSARWVQHLLLPDQMGQRVKRCHEYCQCYNDEDENFLNRIITCDETWIHFFEPESKQQSSMWKHPSLSSPTKALISRSAGKVMAIIFCDIQGIILNHLVPPKTTVTGNYYVSVIKSDLLPAIKRKRPQLMRSWILLHYDNVPSHSSQVVLDTIKELDIEILPHPAYSPDLAICDFWLFPNLKNKLRGEKYESGEELRRAVDIYLRDMSPDGLHHVFWAWVERWDKCKLCKGRYFEKE